MCLIQFTPEIAQRVRERLHTDAFGFQVGHTCLLLLSVVLLTIQADDVVTKLVNTRTPETWDYINIAKVQLLSYFGLLILYMLLAVDFLLCLIPIHKALFDPFASSPPPQKLRSYSSSSTESLP